jgi:pilus assembly protein CpaE
MTTDKKKIKILIVDDIPEARENLKKLLAFEPDFDVVGAAGTGREGLDMTREFLPYIILMDINMPDMDGITATNELRRTLPSVGVVMMSVQGEAEYIRRAMAAGARDFLTKPPPAEELYATIRRVHEIQVQTFGPGGIIIPDPKRPDGKPKLQTGRETHIVVVYSPQGGAGKTTIATNVAAALMREDTKVLLMDLDLQFGDVGVFLNLKPQATIVDLIKSVDDFDPDLVDNVLVTHDSGLRVLLAPLRPEDAESVPPEKVPVLVEKLKGMFDFIVIDLPSRLDDLALSLFDMAERLLLVVNPTLPAVKNTLTTMTLMDTLEYPEGKTLMVVNRHTPDLERARVTIPVPSIEQKLKRTALGVIPMDERRVLYAVNRGIAVVARDRNQSPARELVALADALWNNIMPKPEAPEAVASQAKAPQSRLSRLFGG